MRDSEVAQITIPKLEVLPPAASLGFSINNDSAQLQGVLSGPDTADEFARIEGPWPTAIQPELSCLSRVVGAGHRADLADDDRGADHSRDVFEYRRLELAVLCAGHGHAACSSPQPQPVRQRSTSSGSMYAYI